MDRWTFEELQGIGRALINQEERLQAIEKALGAKPKKEPKDKGKVVKHV